MAGKAEKRQARGLVGAGPDKIRSGSKPAGASGGGTTVKLLAITGVAGAVVALATGLFFFRAAEPIPAVQAVAEPPKPLISTSRARQIHELRGRLRIENRSSHNQNLARVTSEDEMVRMAVQSELTLLAGLFNYYMETNAKFYEFFRITSNSYFPKQAEEVELFDKELVPEFEMAERRRKLVRRRIEHDTSVELYDYLDYIAYYDSIAVYSFRKFLVEGKPEDFTYASDQIITAKFMIKDYWERFRKNLEEYGVAYRPNESVWRRYYGPWEY